MGQALYRTHRPRKLSEVIGQEHITKTLQQAIKQGRISHAYLLTGPRGVGKTSVARILAHEINELPYKDDKPHLDIIEIDAASNRRIDEIRELREKVHVAPTSAKYKVYIIDEVHMLTREAFNALLKTLEEPPAHVVFILATTDAHKLPETIISRTQRFNFKPVEQSKVMSHLRDIAKQEKLKINDEVLALLAEHGEGSFRDSISLLDQAGTGSAITLDTVRQLLGIPPEEAIDELLGALQPEQGSETAHLMQVIASLYDQGYQAAAIAKRLGSAIRRQLVADTLPVDKALTLLADLLEVPVSHDPERALEIILLRHSAKPVNVAPRPPTPVSKVEQSASEPKPVPPVTPSSPPVTDKSTRSQQPADAAIWPEVLQALKQQHNTLYGVVRMAQPDFSEAGSLKLAFAFPFHQKRLNENANREKLARIIQDLTGTAVHIEGLHDKDAQPPAAPLAADDQDNPNLMAISNIFGSAELLES